MKKKLVIALAAALIGAAVLSPAAALAGPSRYVYEMCDSALPGGGVDGVVYGPNPQGLFSSENTCAQPGGALILRQNEIVQGGGGATDWAVPINPPPGGTLESITITAAACGVSEPSIWSLGWIAPPTSWPVPSCGQDVRSFRLVNAFKAFFIELKCVDYSQEDRCNAGPWVLAHYFATTVLDSTPPTLGQADGSMLSEGVKRGRQSLGIGAEDVGGGLSSISVYVNGLPAAPPKAFDCDLASTHNASVYGTVATQIAPCPSKGEANWTIDTGTYPFRDGANSVRICASDFSTLSDPNTSCAPPSTVVVDNSCTESAVAGGEVLSAQFESSNAEEATVGYGKPATVTGRLANDAGDPVRGASLCIKMQTIGVDGQAAGVGSAMTDANGRYRYEVAPGPNREIVVGYRHDSSQVARDVRYYAHARPQLRLAPAVLRNGEQVRLWGHLPGPLPGRRVVVLQANAPGSKRWITFHKATSDPLGAFKSNYRFTSTTRRTRYRFRAIVPRQAGYPWLEGSSEPAGVLVKGGAARSSRRRDRRPARDRPLLDSRIEIHGAQGGTR
jgi:protocatechuate 3,4-dioxygenase beta subunit